MFTLETHSHTAAVSPCGVAEPEETIELYTRAGYDGIIITDHFSDYNPLFDRGIPWKEKVDIFWTGFEDVRDKAVNTSLTVLPALELTFRGDPNDYLVYGLERDWMNDHSAFHHWNLEAFGANVDRDKILLVQAHPFRLGMRARKAPFVDGIEVYNGNPRNNSRNEKALAWAKKQALLQTSGSDYHKTEDCARGGMVFSQKVNSIADFIRLVKEGEGEIIREGQHSSCVLC